MEAGSAARRLAAEQEAVGGIQRSAENGLSRALSAGPPFNNGAPNFAPDAVERSV